MQLLRATFSIAALQLPRLARSKRFLLCALLATGPAVFALLVGQFSDDAEPIELLIYPGLFMGLGVGVPILSLIVGSGVVADERDDRTITYVFTRPVPRAALLLGRWIATALLLAVALAAGALLFAVAAEWGASPDEAVPPEVAGPMVAMAVVGGLVYSAIFASLGTFLKHPMIVGLGYCFAVEALFANLPGKLRELTVQFYLRSFVRDRGGSVWDQVEVFQLGEFDSAPAALTTLSVILLAALAVGSWVVSRRQYVLSA